MSYIEVTIIVAGALDEIRIFSEEKSDEGDKFLEAAKELLERSKSFDEDAEIYVLHHAHGIEAKDCTCAQYVTDHHPFWSNREEV